MKRTSTIIKTRVLATLLLTVVALLAGQSAWAQSSTFTIENVSNLFIIRRSNTSKQETICYRVVGLSAVFTKHFAEKYGTLTFEAGENYKEVQVNELEPGNTPGDIIYSYSTDAKRSYRFEVLDETQHTVLTSYTKDLTFYRLSDSYISNGADLIYIASDGSFASAVPDGKYYDLYWKSTDHNWFKVEDGYDYSHVYSISDNVYRTPYINIQEFINAAGLGAGERMSKYLNMNGVKICAAVGFTQKEEADGYQYIQILVDNNAKDGADPDGKVNDPNESVYKACFELYKGSPAYTNEGKQFFPHRYDCVNRSMEAQAYISHSEFFMNESYLWQQKFKQQEDWDYRAPTAGAIMITPETHDITVLFDAAGSGSDTWYFKDLFVRLTVCDNVAPTLLDTPFPGARQFYRGTPMTISIPFWEVVQVSGTPTITTTWGTFTYEAGAGSNVLTFSGTIDAIPGTQLSVTGMSGTVTDLAGNAFVWPGTQTTYYNLMSRGSLDDFAKDSEGRYLISTKEELYLLAQMVNDGVDTSGKSFLQTADITCDATYTPIGTSKDFKGIYNGGGHSISSITINAPDNDYQGLFGSIQGSKTSHAKIMNVVLHNSSITGKNCVGGIAGEISNYSEIENCRVESSVSILAGGNSADYHGGIVGEAAISSSNGTISIVGCVSAASVSNNGYSNCSNYGGIVGELYKSSVGSANNIRLENCLYTGSSVIGSSKVDPVVGYSSGSVVNCYYTNGNLTGNYRACTITLGSNVGIAGDLTAYNVSKLTAIGSTVMRYNNTYLSGEGNTVNLSYNGTVPTGKAPVYSVNGEAISGSSFSMPAANATVTATLATDYAYYWGSGNGSSSRPYIITTTAGLDLLATEVKGGETFSGKYFKLGNDIAYSTAGLGDTDENFTTIGGYFDGSDKNFSGTFDGQRHTISGIRLYKSGTGNADKNLGLFGRIDGAIIQNVILSDARITGYRYVGGLVGNKVSGTVQNCLVVESTITCADKYVGALFGKNTGTLTNNYYYNCTVNGTANAAGVGAGGNGGVSSSSDITTNNGAVPVISLADNADNNSVISSNTGSGRAVALTGRTLYKDGNWNTLCLPFGVTGFTGTPLKGATVMELDTDGIYNGNKTGYDAATGTLYLYFKKASKIVAGKPYIVKWNNTEGTEQTEGTENILNPVFSGVTIDASAPTAVTSDDGKVTFVGSYAPIALTIGEQSNLFLGAQNALHYPGAANNDDGNYYVNACRAYFAVGNDALASDKDNSGTLTITDVAIMINHILTAPTTSPYTAADVTALANAIIGKSAPQVTISLVDADGTLLYQGVGSTDAR